MEPEKKLSGAKIGLIVIIIILILGGLYMWMSNKTTIDTNTPVKSESITTEDSSQLDALQQDLETTDIDIGASVIESVQ